ncbi:MAG TPA: histidine triad nucleotide-binding protein [Gemmatimonadaceae bacterium]|nr:histidine triad nucleotide-binding protein [Gemmatimonadaceae bacterium]
MTTDCLFCRVVRGEIPATTIAETEDCIAFRDINPQAPVHVLVIPREHVESLSQTHDAAMVGRLALLAAQIAEREGIAESGYRTVINTNGDAGQTVPHLHLHLLGGRSMGWPPG